MRQYFTDETWHMMHQLQAIRLGESLKGEDLNLYMTKLTQHPLSILSYKVDRMLGRVQSHPASDQVKMFTYDGHDTQAVNLLRWLDASNLDYPHPTVYATQVSFELLYSDECLSKKPSEACFSVQVMYNGIFLEFEGACAQVELCTYREFMDYLSEKKYAGPHSDDLRLACDL